jgi:hypothetical protein
MEVRDGNDTARAIFDRHYSRQFYRDGRKPKLFVGPGEKMVLIRADGDALFVWRKFRSDDGQQGVNCAVFRNDSNAIASTLIKEAVSFAWERWPGERLYTYVDPRHIPATMVRGLPVFGYCFYKAGWKFSGVTKGRLHILERVA